MTTIRKKIEKPFLVLTILIPIILMLIVSLSISFFTREWAKKDLAHVANGISTSLRGNEKDLNRLIPLINATNGSTTVEVLFYNLPKKLARFANRADSFVSDEVRAQAYQESLELPVGTVGAFSVDGDQFYIVEIEHDENAQFDKVIYISKELPLDRLATNINLVLLAGTLVTIVAAGVITSGLTKSIARPIERVTYCIENMKSDDVLEMNDKSDSIELRRLIASFNSMSKRIYKYQQSQNMFLNHASHELRTPLMSIQGYAEGIEMGIFQDYKNTAHLISEQSTRLTKLVDGLLTLARAENFKENKSLERLNLGDSLYGILNGYQGYASKNSIEIRAQIADNIFAQANNELLSGAAGNVLSNAIRYAKSTVCLTLMEKHGKAIIAISDDGTGISDVDTMFQRFSKGEGGNFGLGLSIAKASVEAMNGEIKAYNDNGAVFEIQLPLD